MIRELIAIILGGFVALAFVLAVELALHLAIDTIMKGNKR